MNLVVLEDPEAVAREGAAWVRRVAGVALATRGSCRVALAGGSTPRRLYARLAEDVTVPAFDWTGVQLFFGDERCVPPEHPDSNFGMVKATLLDRIVIPAANVHRMRGEDGPAVAAAAYERELGRPIDLAILGMGTDGHTASLFPHSAVLSEADRACAATQAPSSGAARLTLTHPVWQEAGDVLFLVTGADKAATLNDVAFGALRPLDLPAQRVVRRPGPVTILCDRAAAAGLPPR